MENFWFFVVIALIVAIPFIFFYYVPFPVWMSAKASG